MVAALLAIGLKAPGEGKDRYPSNLPIDLTPDDESNTISVTMLNRQGSDFL